MHKIGEFSKLGKVTVKTLRYYESEGLLIPAHVDCESGYRFYENNQLVELSKIIALRQIGLSTKNIYDVMHGADLDKALEERKEEIKEEVRQKNEELSRLKHMMEESKNKIDDSVSSDVIIKEIAGCIIFYKEGIIDKYSDISSFILEAGAECVKLNPNIKCIEPDYCYTSYLDGEYKEENIKVRFSQAVDKMGIESDNIKFKKEDEVTAACIYHKGGYSSLSVSYAKLFSWIEANGYEPSGYIRERYLDGVWNKESEDEYLTELEIPIKKINVIK